MSSVEIWRAIPSFPNYEVSNLGQVRSCPRVDEYGHAIAGGIKPQHLSGPRRNYVTVQLASVETASRMRMRLAREGLSDSAIDAHIAEHRAKGRRMTNAKVHRIVLEAFVGSCPDGMVGCHNDGDTLNNHLGNLRWDTPSNNNRDKRGHGTNHQLRKTHCPSGHEYTTANVYENLQGRKCKQCARDRASNQGTPKTLRTHCRNGHEFTPDNTMTEKTGARKCRACSNDRQRARYANRKQS